MSTDNRNDLSTLIDQAANQVSQKAARLPTASHKPARSLFKPLSVALMTGLTAYAVITIRAQMAPPGRDEIAHDLEIALDKARDSIEATRRETGKYPDALPNAALASVVRYNHETDSYQLTATIMGIRVTLEPGGRKRIEEGVPE